MPIIALISQSDSAAVVPIYKARIEMKHDRVDITTAGNASGIRFTGNWDLSNYRKIRFTVENKDTVYFLQFTFSMQNREVKNFGKAPKQGAIIDKHDIAPGQSRTFEVYLPVLPHPEVDDAFRLMGCTPYSVGYGLYSYRVDLSRIVAIQFSGRKMQSGMQWAVSDIEILPGNPAGAAQWIQMSYEEFFPFIDRYGQFKYREWPGKIHNDRQLQKAARREARDLARHQGAGDRSPYGGWKDGPRQNATGRFRTAKIDGKWWLVDPDGYLFWSHGVVRVNPASAVTPLHGKELESRCFYFEDLPKERDEFARFYSTHDELLKLYYDRRGIDSTYDFSSANLYRKYGPDYKTIYAYLAHRRLKSWGMNTISNSSDKDIYLMDKTAYVERIHVQAPAIEGSKGPGTWQFADPFGEAFAESVRMQLTDRKRETQDPWCIGFFVDNELHWGDTKYLAECTLKAPASQPAKKAMLAWLKKKYPEISDLNKVWGTRFVSWLALADNQRAVPQGAAADLEAFNREIIRRYFRTIREIFNREAPGLLYLGCRFAGSNPDVLAIGAEYADVVSFNRYRYELDTFRLPEGLDKPVIIGEFHFGAMDRGMFHGSLIDVGSQQARGEAYERYVRSALRNPLIIGTQWHQWADQATTGRHDGENYQVGLLDVCDNPYSETIHHVRKVGYKMYEIRTNTK